MTWPEEVFDILKLFYIEDDVLEKISESIEKEMISGLERGSPESSIAMLPSYISALPDGTELGKYVAIVLSGKNLQIMLLTLKGAAEEPEQINHTYIVPSAVMKGTGEQLFTFVANCLLKFLRGNDLAEANLPAGFVFSYPCELISIRCARLLWWTKGFDIKDCLQKDVVKLLEEALEMNSLSNIKIKAVMNDSVGQLASANYIHGASCTIGVVIGYGCNSSYMEKTEKIKKIDPKALGYNHDKMIVITEWEEFGAKGEFNSILNRFDKQIDEASVHKGKQMIDKLTGALYLGELVRRILVEMVKSKLVFNGKLCENLTLEDSFPTKYISEILEEEEGSYKVCRRICDELEIPSHCSSDYEIIRELCHVVSQRSASIVAAAVAALLRHMNQESIKIGVGGALFQFHPTYHELLEQKLRDLAPLNVKWELVHAGEGSAKGAAIIAAVAEKLKL